MVRGTSVFATAVICAIALAACGGAGGGGGSSGESQNDLVVARLELVDGAGSPTGGPGDTNAFRNNRLRIVFTRNVDADSVNDRTILIGVPSSGGLFLAAEGRFEVDGNEVLFDPTVTATGAPHPLGFDAGLEYSVTVRGVPDAKAVRSDIGKPVLTEYVAKFTTSDSYLPDFDQPRIEAVEPQPDEGGVDSKADITVTFSEPMNPESFANDTTFRVVNLDRGGQAVFGTLRYGADARSVTFRPTFGYGKGPARIHVTLTADATDLAGNAISNPREWVFTSEFDPSAINEGLLTETFESNDFEDTEFTPEGAAGRAKWNPATDPGRLVATFGTSSIVMPFTTGGIWNSIPLSGGSWNSTKCQFWYKASELGSAGTVSGLKFWPSTTSSPGAVLSNFTVKIGHTTQQSGLLTSSFAANFDQGSPATVVNGVSWTLPATMSSTAPTALPAFQSSFGFDGQSNVVIEVSKASISGGTQSWQTLSLDANRRRAWSTTTNGGQNATAPSGSDTRAYRWTVDFRTETSQARSRWYRTESAAPTFLEPIVNPVENPAGTEAVIRYAGARDDGTGNPDPATATALVDDISELDGYEYIRFRVSFTSNLGTGVGPKLYEVILPYTFF
jgi:hypothetical protein